MRPQLLVKAALVACIVGAVIMLVGPTGIAQQGPPPGKGGGETEAAVNNLSYPAVMIGNSTDSPKAALIVAATEVLGLTFSWGCLPPESTYPNTSCVKPGATGSPADFLTREDCLAQMCAGQGDSISKIYWQKVNGQTWWAETTAAPSGGSEGVAVDYLDWGDNLESRSWTTTSVIRVETTPFKDYGTPDKTGYQMWHAFGQGTNEIWGVRGTADGLQTYMYDTQYSIIRSINARINFAYLGKATNSSCPTSPGWTAPYTEPPWSAAKWVGVCTLKDEPYTAELNVGGKYVYGYNWSTKRDLPEFQNKCGQTDMAGWWRLTFYTPAPAAGGAPDVVFATELPKERLAPPPLPVPTIPLASAAAESETGFLYSPKVAPGTGNLTYIDICINGGSGKGSGKK